MLRGKFLELMSNSFVTPRTVAHKAPLFMGYHRQEYWSKLPFPSPGNLPDPGIKPVSPDWQVGSPPLSHLGRRCSHLCCSVTQLCPTLCDTVDWNLLKLMSIKSVMPSNHLVLCHPFLLLPSIFPSIRVFSNESVLCIRWPKHWSFRASVLPMNIQG